MEISIIDFDFVNVTGELGFDELLQTVCWQNPNPKHTVFWETKILTSHDIWDGSIYVCDCSADLRVFLLSFYVVNSQSIFLQRESCCHLKDFHYTLPASTS